MKLSEPRIDVCADGGPHVWLLVAVERDDELAVDREHLWCRRCGCLTQAAAGPDGEKVVAVTADDQPHLARPEILGELIAEYSVGR